MSDRDLLEAAARAAGLLVQGVEHFLGVFTGLNIRADDCPGGYRWNPLTDDGDAFRLAVKLNMGVQSWGCQDGGYALARWASDDGACVAEAFDAGGDPAAAARRAIVRAAAALTQPEGGA